MEVSAKTFLSEKAAYNNSKVERPSMQWDPECITLNQSSMVKELEEAK